MTVRQSSKIIVAIRIEERDAVAMVNQSKEQGVKGILQGFPSVH